MKLETNEVGEYSWIRFDETLRNTPISKPLHSDESYQGHFFDFSKYGFLFEISFRNSSSFEIFIKTQSPLNQAPTPTPTLVGMKGRP